MREEAGRLLTVPDELAGVEEFWVTGNEFVALPEIRARDGTVLSLNVLSWSARGLLELVGTESVPLLRVGVEPSPGEAQREEGARVRSREPAPGERGVGVAGDRQEPAVAGVHRAAEWIPEVIYRVSWGTMRVTWLTPPGHKGLVVHAEVDPPPGPVTIYLEGQMGQVRHRVFTPRALPVPVLSRWHRWMECLLWEVGYPWPFLALAVRPAQADARLESWPEPGAGERRAGAGAESSSLPAEAGIQPLQVADTPVRFRVSRQGSELTVMMGVACDGDGAACQVVDMLRHGYPYLREESLREAERLGGGTEAARGEETLRLWRRNLLFNFYYSRGRCLDSEQEVLVTSRSPRYYVCAAHWSRDSLLWSFPGLLVAEPRVAREALLTAFRLYARRAGTHSLYLDGTELYPGFELDELAAFPLALALYLQETDDRSVLDLAPVREGLAVVWERLEEVRLHPHHVYRTFLLPSDDPAHHPVVTYDNVLAWKALRVFAGLGWVGAGDKADRLREELTARAVVPGPFGPMWAWSFDPPADSSARGEAGTWLLYDEPPGSLALLPHYGWCDPLDPVYLNTLRWIWSPHNPWYVGEGPFAAPACPHARHPWVMALANALLVPPESWRALGVDPGRFPRTLAAAPLDGGLACETVDACSGRVRTGAAFATCAGFMAYALARAGLRG
ncbi:MAG: glycoside hydrolase family 125 protein [Firmicutes bacterium]|nr:glycoside hydrolase family 125 protein [Bacillota bacterium]